MKSCSRDIRDEFEAWAESNLPLDFRADCWVAETASYANGWLQIAWCCWQASRAQAPEELLCVCGATWAIHGPGNHELTDSPPSRAQGAAPTGAIERVSNFVDARTGMRGLDPDSVAAVNGLQAELLLSDLRALLAAASNAEGPKPDGWRWLKDTTPAERNKNGEYMCECCHCLRMFTGHKRDVSCAACSAPPSSSQEGA